MGYKATVAYLDHRTGRTKWEMLPDTVFRASDAITLAIRMLYSVQNLEVPIQSIDQVQLTKKNAHTILLGGIERGDYNYDTHLAGYIIYKGRHSTNPPFDKNSNVISMFGDLVL